MGSFAAKEIVLKLSLQKLFIILLLFSCLILKGNYSEYFDLINAAEEKFILNKDRSCYKYYDLAFKKYKPFLKDPFIASQIAFYLSDTSKFYAYLKVCFNNGMPLTSLNASVLFKNNLSPLIREKVKILFDKEYKKGTIDSVLYNKICVSCFQSDSIKLIMGQNPGELQKFYKTENEIRNYILNNYLKKGIFINEQLLGITSDAGYTAFLSSTKRKDPYAVFAMSDNATPTEFELRLKCPFNIIVHSYCFFNQHKELFYQSLLNGYLHPKEYAILEEWSTIHFKKDANSQEICESPEKKAYYNIYKKDPLGQNKIYIESEEGLKQVEKNRAYIHLQKYSIDMLKKDLQKQTGIIFFFDFADGYIY